MLVPPTKAPSGAVPLILVRILTCPVFTVAPSKENGGGEGETEAEGLMDKLAD